MIRVLHSEWTKLRTVRGWVVGLFAGAAVIVALGLAPGVQGSCGQHGPASECVLPVGPDGLEVSDSFTFVHQGLTGDGSITVRVTSLTGLLPPAEDDAGRPPAHSGQPGPAGPQGRPGLVPWAKAGLIIKDGTRAGSAYAAVMVTGAEGVRLQHNYVNDRAGRPGGVSAASPRWLRLTRAGDSITGAESFDGSQWTDVGTVRLPGLPATVQAGLFVTSPQYAQVSTEGFGSAGAYSGPTEATAAFDRLQRTGSWTSPEWTDDRLGGDNRPATAEPVQRTDGGFTVSGSGDIAPAVAGAAGIGVSVTQTLVGTFAGLILVVVIAAMFVTAEYRRGQIRTTFAATPARGQVLLAKAAVVAAPAFVLGCVAAAVVVTLGQPIMRDHGAYVHPATTLTEARLVVGTGALLGVAAMLAVGLGALLRRSTTAVTVGIVAIVLPYLLAISVLPAGAAQWLLRLSPAAAFAVQQSTPQYHQVANLYTPVNGYFPLPPWVGFGVLCAWAAAALGLAVVLVRRRDA